MKQISRFQESSFLSKKEASWWNANLEGGEEKLAVNSAVTSTASGSKNPEKKADHWSPRTRTLTREESEGVKLIADES